MTEQYYIIQRPNLSSKTSSFRRMLFKVVPESEEIYQLKFGSWFYLEIPPRFQHHKFKTDEVTFQSRLESLEKKGVKITVEEWHRLRALDRI